MLKTAFNTLSSITRIVFFLVLVNVACYSQAREHLLKCGYIEKFTHFIEWRDNGDSLFQIAVIGEKDFSLAMKVVFKNVKVDKKEVKILPVTSVDQIDGCKIVVIVGVIRFDLLKKLLDYTYGKQILTIGEVKGYGSKGVIINMLVLDNYIRYEINKEALDKSGLKISSLLLSSAIIL